MIIDIVDTLAGGWTGIQKIQHGYWVGGGRWTDT